MTQPPNAMTQTMKPLISAHNITVMRGRHALLQNVSLHVGERDFITVVGPNGAGKSTLLKCLLGFHAPDSGAVARAEGLKTGYVPQRFSADRAIPISARRFLTLRRKADDAAVARAAAETAVGDVLDKPLYALSDGELQRVLLTRALLGEPQLLVLDEPAQNLDISGQLAFYKLLERIYREREMSILMVSHDLHLVMASTRRVVCLFHHVCCSGEPHEVAKDPDFIALFGDDMARMMAVYHHVHDHVHERTGGRADDGAEHA